MFRTIISLLILFLSIGISAQLNLNTNSIPKALLKNSDVIIRDYNEIVILKSQNELIQHVESSITVLNEDANIYLQHILNYKSSSEKVKIKRIEYYNKTGKLIKKIKKKEIEDMSSYDSYSMISDERMKTINYKPTQYPVSIRIDYQIQSSNTLHIPNFIPIRNYNVSIEKSNYKFINETNINVEIKHYNFENYNITKTSEFEFVLKNQPAFRKEKYSPSFLEIFPHSFIRNTEFNYEKHEGKFNDWNDFGNWINESFLINQNDLKKKDLPLELDFLDSKNYTDSEKVEKLYKYIQDNTRYILINLKDGGLKPMKSSTVNDLKYGDCKALSFYMYSILKMKNIPVKYGIVHADSEYQLSMDEGFPNPYQANHIILNIPLESNDIWLDCTSNTNPFNYLGSFTDNRKVLLVNDKETIIKNTPDYGKELNKISVKSTLNCNTQTLQVHKINYGLQMGFSLYLEKQENEKINKLIGDHYFKNIKSLKLREYTFNQNKKDLNTSEHIDLSSKYLFEKIGDYILLPSSNYSFDLPTFSKKKTRSFQIQIGRTIVQQETLEIIIPDGYELTDTLENISIVNKFGTYNCEYKIQNNTIKIARELTLFKNKYPPKQRSDFKKFIKKVNTNLNFKIGIKKP